MIKEPPGIRVIPKGFCGYHFLPLAPTSSPRSPELQLNKKATIAVNAINFFISIRLNFEIQGRKPIYKISKKQFFFEKPLILVFTSLVRLYFIFVAGLQPPFRNFLITCTQIFAISAR